MGSATLLSKKFELKTSVRKLAATCSQTRFFWTCLMSSRTSVHYNITLLHYHIKRISTIIYPNHSGILALSWQWPFGWFTASATMVRQVALVRLREKQALSRATDHVPAKGAALGDPFRVTIGAHHVATSEHLWESKPNPGSVVDLFIEGRIGFYMRKGFVIMRQQAHDLVQMHRSFAKL